MLTPLPGDPVLRSRSLGPFTVAVVTMLWDREGGIVAQRSYSFLVQWTSNISVQLMVIRFKKVIAV